MSLPLLRIGLVSLMAATLANAQVPLPFNAPGLPKQYQELMTAMVAAQAKAVRPGDEALACPALEKELMATMNDPAIQTYAAKSGALAEKQALAAAKAQGPQAPQAAAALAATLGAGLPGPAAQMAQDQLAHMKVLLPILPQMMRSQQLMALAFAKQCAWIAGSR